MARTDLTIQTVTRSGLDITYESVLAANDAMFLNDGATWVHVKNAGASQANLTFVTPATILSDNLAVADLTGAVPASDEKLFGPFPTPWFNNTGTDAGKVYLDTDQNISVAAVKLGALA